MPLASSVAKFARAQTSPGFSSTPRTERLDDAAADLKFQRIVAEQTEMAGTAAGRDAGRGGNHAALRGIFGLMASRFGV
jgi:hypothetical protein